MSLFDLVDVELLNEIQHGIAQVSGLSMSIWDYGTDRTTAITNMSSFCRLMRSSPEGNAHCMDFAGRSAKPGNVNEVSEYTCEAGLCHMRAAVALNDKVIGGVLMGQAAIERLTDDGIMALGQKFGLDPDELLSEYKRLPDVDSRALHQAMQLAKLSATALARYAQFGAETRHLAERVRSEKSFCQAVFDRLNDGIAVTDEEGRVIDCNAACATMAGTTVERMRGQNLRRFAADKAEYTALLKRVLLGMHVDMHADYLRDDGSVATAEISVATFKLDGETRIICVFRDVGEQQEVERRVRVQTALLDSMHESVTAADVDGNVIYWSPGAERLHGWSRDEMLGRGVSGIYADEDSARPSLTDIVKDGTWTGKRVLLRKDGSTFTGEISLAAVHDADNRLIGTVGVCRACTDRSDEKEDHGHRIAELSRLCEEMFETDRTKKRFIANVLHELRTPLSTLGVYIDMLHSGVLGEVTPAQKRATGVMLHNVDRLAGLITEMFDSVRLDAGRLVIQRKNVDIGQVVGRSVEHMAPLAKAAMLTLDYEPAAGLVAIEGDADRLTQVFSNLIGNAVKYNRPNGSIRVAVEDHGRGVVIVTVSDTGVGIPEEEQGRIFDQFYQVTEPDTQKYGGTGLGLTLARQIVDLHAGHMSLESESGKGSVFRVVLPTVSAAPAVRDESPAAERPDEGADAETPKLVLVIEDNEELFDMLRIGFKSRGFAVRGAHSGADGMRIARECRPDVIVLDLALPDTDGIEVCSSLRADDRFLDVPVIGITAWSSEDDLDRFTSAGVCTIIRKPFVFKELLREVMEAVG